jgi:phosphomannomutase/phosphoglucomutase
MAEGEPHRFIARLRTEGKFPGATERITIDGIRAEYPHGFGLARASNTTPVVVLRFEGDTPEALRQIEDEFRDAIGALLPGRALPF